MKASEKNQFTFNSFCELKQGDVFKFEKIFDSDMHSVFFTVYHKDENITKINSTYGKKILRFEYPNSLPRGIMIFENRKRK
jgi:hypothetical protein